MTFQEIRDHKFKILFTYYFQKGNIDDVLLYYFENFPYEEVSDINDYTKGNSTAHKTIHKVAIEDADKVKNVSDAAIEISIGEEENIREIKQKVKDIVSKTNEIDELISKNLNNWDMTRVGKAELTIIRLAIYEMYFDSSIDLEVAINEAVELAKVYGDDKADKFINGVLATIYKAKQ